MSCVITGIGVIAPTGHGIEDYWKSTVLGRSAIAPITRFHPNPYLLRLAGQLRDVEFDRVPPKLLPQTDVWTQHGLLQAQLAFQDAGLSPSELPEYQLSVATASSAGGVEFGQREIESLWRDGPSHVSAFQSIAWFYAATTGQLSIRHGMRGQCDALVTEGAGGLDSLGLAAANIAEGATVVLCGGTDSALSPYGVVCQLASGLLSDRADPDSAFLPFDEDANGYLPGEGGAMLVVESADRARERGAGKRYGKLTGYAAAFDPRPGSGRDPVLTRTILSALAAAGLESTDIDVVFADAYGVPELDRQEAAALHAVFGPRGVPVTAPKAGTGRLYSGGGALDVVTALLAIRDGVVPPTPHVRRPRPEYELDLVLRARPASLRRALVVARGFGGFNAALVVEQVG